MAENLTTATIDVRGNTRGLEKDILKALRTVEFSQIDTKKSSQALGRITGKVSEFNKSLEASNARVVAFGASAGAIFAVQKAFSSLISSTIEVEKKLADINVILGLSSSSLEKFGSNLFSIAKNTAQSFDAVADAATELSRQGLGVEETLKRTNAALVLTRLSGLDAKKSVEALTATLNSFSGSALDAVEVVNKLANVDAAFAVSSADLANAIARVGSSAVDAGVSLDELIALVTSAQQTTARGGSVIGNSFKTIFTRLQRGKVKSLLGELGIDTSESQNAISLLNQLASVYDTLGATQKAYVAEQVGGVFQINILKAALSDLGKEYSIFGRALDTSLSSTDQAIKRNELLNQTVSALSNQAVSNLQQAANKIGSIVFEPNAKSFLSGFNNLLDSFNNIDSESAGGRLMEGFFKGIGDFISGPGAILATAVIVKLFATLSKFAAGSVQELLGTNKVAKQQVAIEQSILSILQKNSQFTSQILTGKMTTVQAEKELLNYLTAQSNILREQERLSKLIGANLAKAGVSIASTGVPMVAATKGKKAASSGFIPNFASDQAIGQAMENVGAKQHGYKAGKAKKTTIHDGNGKSFKSFVNSKEDVKTFTNAAGKKATIVKPPNGFGENTQYAAGGFVPNFAQVSEIAKLNSRVKERLLLSQSPKGDGRLNAEDLINLSGRSYIQKQFPIKSGEKFKDYENRVIKQSSSLLGKNYLSGDLLRFSTSAAVDGFSIQKNGNKTLIDLLEVKGGKNWNPTSVLNKFLRALPENYLSNNPLDVFTTQRDNINVGATLVTPYTKGKANPTQKKLLSKASGFIPNFGSKMQELFKNIKMREGQDDPFKKRAQKANLAAKKGIPLKNLGKLDYTMIHASDGGKYDLPADYLKEDRKTKEKTQYTAKITTAGLDPKKIMGGSVENRVGDALVTEANNLAKTVNPSGGTQFSNYKQLSNTGSVFSAAGTVFESAVRQAFNVPAQGQADRIDFPSPSSQLRSFFGNATGPYEAKISNTSDNRSSALSKWVAVKGLGQGFVPNFAGSRSGGLSFVQKDKDEFGFSELQAVIGGKRVGSFSYAEDKPGQLDVGDFTVNKSERGRGIGSELYKEAIRRNAGKKMKGQLLPQMNRLLQKIKKGEPVSAETLYPQIKRADLAKSSVFEVHGHKGMTVEKMNRDQFASFVNAKITELKKDPKKLQSYFGNVEADEYGGLGVDLQTQHSSGFVPNFLDIKKDRLPLGVRGRMNYGVAGSKSNIQLGAGAEQSTLAHELFHNAYSRSTFRKAASNPSIGKFISNPGKYAGAGGVISDTLFKGVNRKNLYASLGLNSTQLDFEGRNTGSSYSGAKGIDEIITRIQEKIFKNKGDLDSLSVDEKTFAKNLEMQGLISGKRLSNVSRRSKEGSKFRKLVGDRFSSTMGSSNSGFVPNFADRRMIQQRAFYSQAAEPWLSGKKIKPIFDPLKGIDFQNIELDKIKSGRFVHSEGVSGENVYSTEEFKNIYNKNKMNRSFWSRRSFEYLSKSSGFIPSFASPQLISEINKRVKNPNIAQKLQEGTGLKDAAYVKAASRLGVNVSGLDYLLPQMGFPLKGKDKVLKLSKALGFGFGRSFILDALKMGDWNYVKPKFEPLGLGKDDFDKLSKYANTPKGESALRWWRSPSSKSAGFVPNFASALNDAISREKSAGLSSSQIYVDQHSSLKNSKNPMGLMVANTRDEPQSGMQGIKRAKKEGRNPKTYGGAMSSGFVPNFAAAPIKVGQALAGSMDGAAKSVSKFKGALNFVERNALSFGFGLQAAAGAASGYVGDTTTESGKFASAVTSAAGTIAGFAGTGAMIFGPKGALIGAGIGAAKALFDVTRLYNTFSPQMEKAFQKSSEEMTRFGDAGQQILQFSEQYSEALASGNSAQAAEIMVRNQRSYAEQLSKLTESQRSTLISAIAQGKGQEGYAKILGELQDSVKAQESALVLQKFSESKGIFGGTDKKIIEGADKNLVQDLTRGLDVSAIQSALDRVSKKLEDDQISQEGKALILMKSLASSEGLSSDQKGNFQKIIDAFSSAAANTDLNSVAEGFIKGIKLEPKLFEDLKKAEEASKKAQEINAAKIKKEIEIRERANASLIKLQSEIEAVYSRFNSSISNFIFSLETASEMRANAGNFKQGFYAAGNVPRAAQSQQEKNIAQASSDRLLVDIYKSQAEASNNFNLSVKELVNGLDIDIAKLGAGAGDLDKESQLRTIQSSIEQSLLPVQSLIMSGDYQGAAAKTKAAIGDLSESDKALIGPDINRLEQQLLNGLKKNEDESKKIRQNSQKDLAIQTQQLIFQKAMASLAQAQNFGGDDIGAILGDDQENSFNTVIEKLTDLKTLGFDQRSISGSEKTGYKVDGRDPNNEMVRTLGEFYKIAGQIAGEPVLSTDSKDFGVLVQGVSAQIRKKIDEFKGAGEGVVDERVFTRLEMVLSKLGGDDDVAKLKALGEYGAADVGGKQILDTALANYTEGAFAGIPPELKKAFQSTTDENAAATILLIAAQEKQIGSLNSGFSYLLSNGMTTNDLLSQQPDAIAAAIGAILEKGRAETKKDEAVSEVKSLDKEWQGLRDQISSNLDIIGAARGAQGAAGDSVFSYLQKNGGVSEADLLDPKKIEKANKTLSKGFSASESGIDFSGTPFEKEFLEALEFIKVSDQKKTLDEQSSIITSKKSENEGLRSELVKIEKKQEEASERSKLAVKDFLEKDKAAATARNIAYDRAPGEKAMAGYAEDAAARQRSSDEGLGKEKTGKTKQQKEAMARSSGKERTINEYGDQMTFEAAALLRRGGANQKSFQDLLQKNTLPSFEKFEKVYASLGVEGGARAAFEEQRTKLFGLSTSRASQPLSTQTSSPEIESTARGVKEGVEAAVKKMSSIPNVSRDENESLLKKWGFEQGTGFKDEKSRAGYKKELQMLQEKNAQKPPSSSVPSALPASKPELSIPKEAEKAANAQQDSSQIMANILSSVERIVAELQAGANDGTSKSGQEKSVESSVSPEINVSSDIALTVNSSAGQGLDAATAIAEQIKNGLSAFLSSPEFVGKVTSIANQAAGNKTPPKILPT